MGTPGWVTSLRRRLLDLLLRLQVPGGRCQAGSARVFPTRRLFLMDCCRVTAAPTSVFMALAVFGRYREERFVAWQQRRRLAELAWFCGCSALLIGLH